MPITPDELEAHANLLDDIDAHKHADNYRSAATRIRGLEDIIEGCNNENNIRLKASPGNDIWIILEYKRCNSCRGQGYIRAIKGTGDVKCGCEGNNIYYAERSTVIRFIIDESGQKLYHVALTTGKLIEVMEEGIFTSYAEADQAIQSLIGGD